ncbi:MAG TPA: SDR family NAD(P)-dependent oxidoreductase [Candidatus Gracilibacteria bacterium]|nr:SDR family NAD(P)-dependent oxidoreductase [Candidatus Gracilibacteria bacterium]
MKNKIAIVTGGARGIGLGAAKNLLKRGYKVCVCSRSEKDVKSAVKKLGKNSLGLVVDVSKEADWKMLLKEVVKKWGRVDVLVNNAGILLQKDLLSMSFEEAENVLHINLLGTWLGIKTVAPIMKKQKTGRIVNTASIAAMKAYPYLSAYCASKAGVVALTRVAALELAPFNIRVNAVCPGAVETPMTAGMMDDKKMAEATLSGIPLHRIGKPDEIGAVIGFLADEESSFVTGSAYVVDGGNIA